MSLFYKGDRPPQPPPASSKENKPAGSTFPTGKQGQPSDADGMRNSLFIKKDQQEKEQGWCPNMCACLSLSYYKDYFKVTNSDVQKRIGSNLKFWDGNFFMPKEQEYDLYGPFWLYTTLIFAISAVHNILIYQSTVPFVYDFQSIGIAFSTVYFMGFGFSIFLACLLKCSGVQCNTAQIICLYGYSIATYILCTLLCSIGNNIVIWGLLLYATGTKIAFILYNIYAGFQIPAAKKTLVAVVVIIEATLQFLIIKFLFLQTSGTVSSAIPTLNTHHNIETYMPYDILHLRNGQL